MNRLFFNGFSKGLSSGLSFFAILAVGYSLNGESQLVVEASGQSISQEKKYEKPSRDFPDGVDQQALENFSSEAGTASAEDDRFQSYNATAYCISGRTASGAFTRRGIIAADPRVLPLGTVVEIRAKGYSGRYTVMDTGPSIKGKKIDVYVPTYREARLFGRQQVKLAVVSRPDAKNRKRSVAASL
jgi:3D (Asp-Asp-Asp) domain-containing protein